MIEQLTQPIDAQTLKIGQLVAARIMENAKPLSGDEKKALEVKIDRFIDQSIADQTQQ